MLSVFMMIMAGSLISRAWERVWGSGEKVEGPGASRSPVSPEPEVAMLSGGVEGGHPFETDYIYSGRNMTWQERQNALDKTRNFLLYKRWLIEEEIQIELDIMKLWGSQTVVPNRRESPVSPLPVEGDMLVESPANIVTESQGGVSTQSVGQLVKGVPEDKCDPMCVVDETTDQKLERSEPSAKARRNTGQMKGHTALTREKKRDQTAKNVSQYDPQVTSQGQSDTQVMSQGQTDS